MKKSQWWKVEMDKSHKKKFCKFCQNESVLCRSHIIPEFLYKNLYDEKHRMLVVEPSLMSETFRQKGYYEYLLCNDCEQYFNVNFEQYYANNCFSIIPEKFNKKPENFRYPGLDYSKYKLFILSVFWRILIAKEAPFHHIKSDEHIQTIQEMLMKQDPGDELDYPLYGYLVVHDREIRVMKDIIPTPNIFPINGLSVLSAMFDGIKWLLILSEKLSFPPPSVRRNGNLHLGVKNLSQLGEIKSIFKAYKFE